jgi:hypothetical protein
MSRDFQNKNDYSVKVYVHKPSYKYAINTMNMEYVHSIYKLSLWVKEWDYFVIFSRRTKQYICIVRRGDYVPNKPQTYQDNIYNLHW